MNTTKNNEEIKRKFYEYYGKEILRKIDLIYDADITNPEALELWNNVKNCDWVKPEIREKWEKALKEKELS